VSAQSMAVTTSAAVSISTQDQQLVDMLKMKIDGLSLKKTEMVWNRFMMIQDKIPTTHSQYRIIEWLGEYIQWSVSDKKEKMMMEMNMMDDMMMPGDMM